MEYKLLWNPGSDFVTETFSNVLVFTAKSQAGIEINPHFSWVLIMVVR